MRRALVLAVAWAALCAPSAFGAATAPGAAAPAGAPARAHVAADCRGLTSPLGSVRLDAPGRPLRVSVLLVAHNADASAARAALDRAGAAYAPLGIQLAVRLAPVGQVPQPPDGAATDAFYLSWLKERFPGGAPAGSDLVYFATSRRVTGGGRADCVGGIADPRTAFAVGGLAVKGVVGVTTDPEGLLPEPAVADGGAKTAAHEIGHLLGAQHHLAACGIAPPVDPDEPCEIMFSYLIQQIGLFFGPVNAGVVRAHAERFVGR